MKMLRSSLSHSKKYQYSSVFLFLMPHKDVSKWNIGLRQQLYDIQIDLGLKDAQKEIAKKSYLNFPPLNKIDVLSPAPYHVALLASLDGEDFVKKSSLKHFDVRRPILRKGIKQDLKLCLLDVKVCCWWRKSFQLKIYFFVQNTYICICLYSEKVYSYWFHIK